MTDPDISLDLMDAKTPFKYVVTLDHVWGAKSKALMPLGKCVQENSINSHPAVLSCKVDKTVARIIFKHKPKVAQRYTLSGEGEELAKINDKYGQKGLYELLKNNPIELWLMVPRYHHSLERLRSEEMKDCRKESVKKRDAKIKAGTYKKRKYTKPKNLGYRDGGGTGRAHMWKDDAKLRRI